jgi:hypothetical protein
MSSSRQLSRRVKMTPLNTVEEKKTPKKKIPSKSKYLTCLSQMIKSMSLHGFV